MKYEYTTVVLRNVFQSLNQALRDSDTQDVGMVFEAFMKRVKNEWWRIIAVTSIADMMVYTLERESK